MEDKLKIKEISIKQPHKTYKINIEAVEHTIEFYKFLKKIKDKRLDVIVNERSVSFSSVASRKNFATGFEVACNIFIEHVKSFADETFAKINQLTAELDKSKSDYAKHKIEWQDAINKTVIKTTVMNLKKSAYEDQLSEYKESCKVLTERVKILENRLKEMREVEAQRLSNAFDAKLPLSAKEAKDLMERTNTLLNERT